MAFGWNKVISVQCQPSHSQGRPAAGSMVLQSEAEVGPELRRAAAVQHVQVEDWKCLE